MGPASTLHCFQAFVVLWCVLSPRQETSHGIRMVERGSVLECVSPLALSTRGPRAGPNTCPFASRSHRERQRTAALQDLRTFQQCFHPWILRTTFPRGPSLRIRDHFQTLTTPFGVPSSGGSASGSRRGNEADLPGPSREVQRNRTVYTQSAHANCSMYRPNRRWVHLAVSTLAKYPNRHSGSMKLPVQFSFPMPV